MTCESTRGEWGKRCPDCGEMLPNPKPLVSWMSQRHQERPPTLSSGAWNRRMTIVHRDGHAA